MNNNISTMYPNLPSKLSNKELKKLLYKKSDMNIRDKIIFSNMGLVVHEIKKRFYNTNLDYDELIQLGVLGLISAVDNFNVNMNSTFSSYACTCIDNEILMFLRKNKKISKEISLEEIVTFDTNGNKITIGETLISDTDVEEDTVDNLYFFDPNKYMTTLTNREKEFVEYYFGFNNKPILHQGQIGELYNRTQSCIAHAMSNAFKSLKRELLKEEKYQIEERDRIKKRTRK